MMREGIFLLFVSLLLVVPSVYGATAGGAEPACGPSGACDSSCNPTSNTQPCQAVVCDGSEGGTVTCTATARMLTSGTFNNCCPEYDVSFSGSSGLSFDRVVQRSDNDPGACTNLPENTYYSTPYTVHAISSALASGQFCGGNSVQAFFDWPSGTSEVSVDVSFSSGTYNPGESGPSPQSHYITIGDSGSSGPSGCSVMGSGSVSKFLVFTADAEVGDSRSLSASFEWSCMMEQWTMSLQYRKVGGAWEHCSGSPVVYDWYNDNRNNHESGSESINCNMVFTSTGDWEVRAIFDPGIGDIDVQTRGPITVTEPVATVCEFDSDCLSGEVCCGSSCVADQSGNSCSDGNACTVGDSTNKCGVCQSGSPKCSGSTPVCVSGSCYECTNDGHCSGSDVCISNTCEPSEVCGNGVTEGSEQCDGEACCTSSCTYKGSGTLCSGSTSWSCAGSGSPNSCGRTRTFATCTGSSATCPSSTTETQNAGVGQVCVSGNFVSASSSRYCGTTGVNYCTSVSGTNAPTAKVRSCDGGGSCTRTETGININTQATCSNPARETSVCSGGSCADFCSTSGNQDQDGYVSDSSDPDCISCGNGVIDSGEECDGSNLGGATCISEGFSGGGPPTCSGCVLVTDSCTPRCGNGVQESGEECDGSDYNGETCSSRGYASGSIGCTSSCTFDESSCVAATCGNGVIDSGEDCDGSNLNGASCVSEGFSGGAPLLCTSSCTFDTSNCISGAVCGDGIVEGSEDCDGSNLDGEDCASLGAGTGTPSCTSSCTFDTSSCTTPPVAVCGNGVTESGEQCDGEACCTSSCTYRSSSYLCSSGSWSCNGACQRTRGTAYCTGSSPLCPGASTETQNAPAGQVCSGGNFVAVSSAIYCGTTGLSYCNGQQPSRRAIACNGANSCSQTTSINIAGGSACAGAENNFCRSGTCINGCYNLDENPADGDVNEDNNGNGLIDSEETGVCAPACSTTNCQNIDGSYVQSACSTTIPSGTADWTREDSLWCAGSGDCYCASCPGASTWDGTKGECIEGSAPVCSNGLDDDKDGATDFFDDDCAAFDPPPTIDSWYIDFRDPPSPLDYYPMLVRYGFQISDNVGVEYRCVFGDGTDTGWISGGTTVIDTCEREYQVPSPQSSQTVGAYLEVREITVAGQTDTSSTISTTMTCNPGSQTGLYNRNGAGCCSSTTCWEGVQGWCYEDTDTSGGPLCIDDPTGGPGEVICDTGLYDPGEFRDRDERAGYAGSSDTCEEGTWIPTGWCEDDASPQTSSTRCDTTGSTSIIPNTGTPDDDKITDFICGDDPDETFVSSVWGDACLSGATPTSCFGRTRSGQPMHFQGTELCGQGTAEWDEDNDCDGLFPEYDLDCTSNLTGQVVVNTSTGDEINAFFSDIWISEPWDWAADEPSRLVGAVSPTLPTPSLTSDDSGYYRLENVLAGWDIEIFARFSDAVEDSIQFTVPSKDEVFPMPKIVLQERVCNSDCTNNLGRCDAFCVGKNGCMMGTPNPDEVRVMNACDPPDSYGQQFGAQVYLDQNETHREVGLCCSVYVGWEEAPRAEVEGSMSALIKYTRLTNVLGKQVRFIIATWPQE